MGFTFTKKKKTHMLKYYSKTGVRQGAIMQPVLLC